MNKPDNRLLRAVRRGAIVIGLVIVYAIGLQVTEIDLKEPQKEQRQEQLTRILRGLARPDLLEFDTERVEVNAPILVPCVPPGPAAEPAQPDQPTITLSNTCAEPGETITVSGAGFQGGETVFIFFVPFVADKQDEIELKLANNAVPTGIDGAFAETVTLRKDRNSEQIQTVRAVVNRRIGSPRPSAALIETVDKIVETVFMALIATTLGVLLAVPFSFLAARNLMLVVETRFAKFMASLVAIPLGAYGGFYLIRFIYEQLSAEAMITSLQEPFSNWDIFGNFLTLTTDAIFLVIPALGVLAGAAILNSLVGHIFEAFFGRAQPHGQLNKMNAIVTIILAFLAGAILFSLVIAIINWFYQLGEAPQVLMIPAIVGGLIFAGIGAFLGSDHPVPSGMIIYYIVRTIMNIFRSIEPLLMVIVFAVWVSIGPFAGVLALMLHTIVALGKLYSEQVENISTGPIEAITATGANRLQTIIYAVIPQIVPPYIAFTVYRWDINVRMSTIIGFGGGGGIGFLLSQNINLLKYRQASVNMIAIALVVTLLDYISAKVRERIT